MVENMRNITQKNLAMQELLRNMKTRKKTRFLHMPLRNASFQNNYYNGEDKIQSQTAEYQDIRKKKTPKREKRG